MKKFEVGKRYEDGGLTFEIIARTEKTVKYVAIHHPGRNNERIVKKGQAKIHNWSDREVFYRGDYIIEAI